MRDYLRSFIFYYNVLIVYIKFKVIYFIFFCKKVNYDFSIIFYLKYVKQFEVFEIIRCKKYLDK